MGLGLGWVGWGEWAGFKADLKHSEERRVGRGTLFYPRSISVLTLGWFIGSSETGMSLPLSSLPASAPPPASKGHPCFKNTGFLSSPAPCQGLADAGSSLWLHKKQRVPRWCFGPQQHSAKITLCFQWPGILFLKAASLIWLSWLKLERLRKWKSKAVPSCLIQLPQHHRALLESVQRRI